VAITAFSQWSTTAALNVDLNSIPLDGASMTAGQVDDAFREMMKQLKSGAAPLVSPTFTTPTLGVAAATSINLSGDGAVDHLDYGIYTPTLTNTTNVAASTNSANTKWTRIGDTVTVYGEVAIDPTAAAPTATVLNISLPIASDITSATQICGVASDGVSAQTGQIRGNTTSDTAELTFSATNTANRTWGFTFMYTVA
jgi:hypothetical protein